MLVTKEIKKVLNDSCNISFVLQCDNKYRIVATVMTKYSDSFLSSNNLKFDYEIECTLNKLERLYQPFGNSAGTLINTAISNIRVNDIITIRVLPQEMSSTEDTLYSLFLVVERPKKNKVNEYKQYTYLLHTTLAKYL